MTTLNTEKRLFVKERTDSLLPFIFLCVYMVLIFVRPHEWLAQLQNLPVIRMSLILTFLTYLVLQPNKKIPLQVVCCICLVFVMLLSGVRNGWFGGGLSSGSDFIISAVLPLLLFSGLTTSVARTKWLMLISITAAMLMVHNGVSQKASSVGIGWAGSELSWMDRITYVGFFNDPNDLGMFFVMVLPFTVLFFLQGGFFKKIIFSFCAVYILYGVYLTNSRGALVSLIAMAVIFSYLNWGKMKTVITGILFSPVLIFILLKFRSIDVDEESAAGRVDSWYEGVQMFFWRPLLGVGQGNFTEYHHITAHNSYVLTLAELGLIGYFLWMVFLLLTLYMVYPLRKLNVVTYPEVPASFSSNRESEVFKGKYNEIKAQKFCSDTMFYSMIGFATTVFFLSRSYALIGYVFAGIAIAQYYQIAKFNGLTELPILTNVLTRILWLTLLSIFILFIIIKIML